MKIYNEVRMDLDGNVVYEDSFWHEGEVAMCMGGGEAPSVSYTQSPEQRQMYALLAPMMRAMSRRAMNPCRCILVLVPNRPQAVFPAWEPRWAVWAAHP